MGCSETQHEQCNGNEGAGATKETCRKIQLRQRIRKWLRAVPCEPGLQPEFMEKLREKVKLMSDEEKVCALVFDKMQLKAGLRYHPGKDVLEGFEDFWCRWPYQKNG